MQDYNALCREVVLSQTRALDSLLAGGRVSGRWIPGGPHTVAGRMMSLAVAYFDPDSPRRGQTRLVAELEHSLLQFERFQLEDGLFDLVGTNYHSAPDTAFLVDDLVPLFVNMRMDGQDLPLAREFLQRLEAILIRAGNGIVRGGIHTPNHRWKVASALLSADRIWPHSRWRRFAQAYLAEEIDIDADGEFTERSTGIYNYVCDRSLMQIGRLTGEAQYLECTDRNLEHMLYLLHADGTLVTSYSIRQDHDVTFDLSRYFLLYWYRALTGGNGLFRSAAELAWRQLTGKPEQMGAGLAVWLRYLRDVAGNPVPQPAELPTNYQRLFKASGVFRRRAGESSLTVMRGRSNLLSVRFGSGPEIILRIAASFANDGQFRAEKIEVEGNRVRLRSRNLCKYYGPWRGKGPATDLEHIYASRHRKVMVKAELIMDLEVECRADGLGLKFATEGCANVPLEIAFIARDFKTIEATGRLVADESTGKRFLDDGELIVKGLAQSVRIGPGVAEHDLTVMRAVESYPGRNACCVRLLAPVAAAEFEIRALPAGKSALQTLAATRR